MALLRELTPRTADMIAGTGERLVTLLFAAHAEAEGVPCRLADAREVVRTDANHGAAWPDLVAIRALAAEHLAPHLRPGAAVVIQGYIGATASGATTTLGRGGSDYTASLLGAALGSREVQIWTDVEGVLTADPRVVPEARPIAVLSFAEAAELAAAGAKVLHPQTIQPAVLAGIPVTVRHARRPAGRFTTITGDAAPARAVTALALRKPVTVVTVTTARMFDQAGWLARLFAVFGRLGVSVDLVATAEVSVSVTVDPGAPLADLRRELGAFGEVAVAEDRAIVAVVGELLKRTPGIAARAFSALEAINVEVISMGANEINLSLVVEAAAAEETLRRLHAALIEGPRA